MQRRSRLTGSKRFSRIHQEGSSSANRLLVIRFVPNGVGQSRFGFVVSKRIGGAVVRNRVKRRLREALRTSHVTAGWDAIFIARKGSDKANYRALQLASDNLLLRNHMVGTAGKATRKYPVVEAPG